jgi:hypothetical protein
LSKIKFHESKEEKFCLISDKNQVTTTEEERVKKTNIQRAKSTRNLFLDTGPSTRKKSVRLTKEINLPFAAAPSRG